MSDEQTYYVYIMASCYNGTLYVGITNNLTRRVYEHKHKLFEGFTEKYAVSSLVWYKTTPSVRDAIEVEKKIKNRGRKYKIDLIETENPQWDDLIIGF